MINSNEQEDCKTELNVLHLIKYYSLMTLLLLIYILSCKLNSIFLIVRNTYVPNVQYDFNTYFQYSFDTRPYLNVHMILARTKTGLGPADCSVIKGMAGMYRDYVSGLLI